jgi:hypothetical protein
VADKSTTQNGGLRPPGGIVANAEGENTETAPFLRSNIRLDSKLDVTGGVVENVD